MKKYTGQEEGKRKNQLLSGVKLSRRDWKFSALNTELQLPDKGCSPPSSFPFPPELCIYYDDLSLSKQQTQTVDVGSPKEMHGKIYSPIFRRFSYNQKNWQPLIIAIFHLLLTPV
jgi:hypothetical protein